MNFPILYRLYCKQPKAYYSYKVTRRDLEKAAIFFLNLAWNAFVTCCIDFPSPPRGRRTLRDEMRHWEYWNHPDLSDYVSNRYSSSRQRAPAMRTVPMALLIVSFKSFLSAITRELQVISGQWTAVYLSAYKLVVLTQLSMPIISFNSRTRGMAMN